MREWNLRAGDPLALNLAADMRVTATDYCNDQIWELVLGGSEPPALALQTTFGLRARSARIFPQFTENEVTRQDPATFATQPVVRSIYPNFIQVLYAPFLNIDVVADYWAASSQMLVGRFTITNTGGTPRRVRLELTAQLTPAPDGERMSPLVIGLNSILAGKTGGLAPVLFLTGGPEAAASPFPSLQLMLDLPAGKTRQVTWVHAACGTPEESFEAARQAAARNFEAELARIELLNSDIVEIVTGDPEWDAAFSLAQKNARRLLLSGQPGLPNASFVITRQPDNGYSRRGDGGDYSPLWNGQGVFEAYFLAGLLLPSGGPICAGLVKNFIHAQAENGSIDGRPGIGGQRSQLLATPLLAALAWKIYRQTDDQAFLEQVFTPLLRFFQAWFTPEQDRDQDGFPEWSHAMELGIDDHPLFAFWQPWAQGLDISTAESPALGALLYRESQALIAMAKKIGQDDAIPALEGAAVNLRTAVEVSWDRQRATYQYWDRDSHFSAPAQQLGWREGPGDIVLRKQFDHPARLQIHLQVSSENAVHPFVFIHGTSPAGQHLVERIPSERIHWFMGRGTVTSERVYMEIERVDVQGLGEADQAVIGSVGFDCQDISLLLPLWANIPAQERVRALVEESITNPQRYWRPYGIATYALDQDGLPEAACRDLHIPWNALIGEGLLNYGYRQEAAELVTRIMRAVITSLKKEAAFRRSYHVQTGQGSGERNALEGLAPLGLFLDTLGVQLISPKKVIVTGFNPYPWPVTVKYRGLTVLKQVDKTTVIFHGGQTVTITDPAAQEVRLD